MRVTIDAPSNGTRAGDSDVDRTPSRRY